MRATNKLFYIQTGTLIQQVPVEVFLSQWRQGLTPIEQIDNDYLLTLIHHENHTDEFYFG